MSIILLGAHPSQLCSSMTSRILTLANFHISPNYCTREGQLLVEAGLSINEFRIR